jgi:hypothetical protein
MWTVPAPDDVEIDSDDAEVIPRDRTVSGVLLALLGHTLTLVPLIEHALLRPHSRDGVEGTVSLVGQAIVLLGCLGTAIWLAVRRDRTGLGRGLLIGWLVGLVWTAAMAVIIGVLDSVASKECCY